MAAGLFQRRLIVAGVLALLAAAGVFAWFWHDRVDPLIAEFNGRYPRTSQWTVRMRQTNVAIGELQRGLIWEAYLALSPKQATDMLSAQLRAKAGDLEGKGIRLSDTSIGLSDQAIDIASDISVKVIRPELEFGGRIEGIAVPAAVGSTVELRFAFTHIRLTSLRWGKDRPADISAALPVLQAAVNAVILNANGALPPSPFELALSPFQPVSPVDIKSDGVTVQGTPIVLPRPHVGAVAFLVGADGLRALVNVGLEGDPASPAASAVTDDPAATEASFRSIHAKLLDAFRAAADGTFGPGIDVSPKQVRMVLTRRFIAKAFNAAAARLDWTIGLSQPPTSQAFDSEVRLFKVPDPQTCTQSTDNRACPLRSCTVGHDERDCSTCLVWRPWGGCALRGNNPLCEAAKATQNKLYEASGALCQADSARLKGECELSKTTQNALYAAQTAACQAGNEILKSLANFAGRVGSVSGTVKLDASGQLKIGALQFLPDLTALTLVADVQAAGHVETTLNFVPSDLAGNLLCQFPVQGKTVRASAALGPTTVAVSSILEGDPPKGVVLVTHELEIAFNMRPPPVEALFAQNPDLLITCSGAGVLAGLGGGLKALGVGNLPQEFTGNFKQKIASQRIPLAWSHLDIPVPGGEAIVLIPNLRINGLFLESGT